MQFRLRYVLRPAFLLRTIHTEGRCAYEAAYNSAFSSSFVVSLMTTQHITVFVLRLPRCFLHSSVLSPSSCYSFHWALPSILVSSHVWTTGRVKEVDDVIQIRHTRDTAHKHCTDWHTTICMHRSTEEEEERSYHTYTVYDTQPYDKTKNKRYGARNQIPNISSYPTAWSPNHVPKKLALLQPRAIQREISRMSICW